MTLIDLSNEIYFVLIDTRNTKWEFKGLGFSASRCTNKFDRFRGQRRRRAGRRAGRARTWLGFGQFGRWRCLLGLRTLLWLSVFCFFAGFDFLSFSLDLIFDQLR